jgi:hypothetical protein
LIIILGFSRFIDNIVVVLLLFIGCRVVVFWAYTIDITTIDATTIPATILPNIIKMKKITDFLTSNYKTPTIYQFDIIPHSRLFQKSQLGRYIYRARD